MKGQDLLTKAELGKHLRVSRATVDRLIERREIPYVKIGRRVLFRREDVDRFIASRIVK